MIPRALSGFISSIAGFIAPVKCAACGTVCGEALCAECEDTMSRDAGGVCRVCRKPPKRCLCPTDDVFANVYFPYFYRGNTIKSLIYKAKHAPNKKVYGLMSGRLADCIALRTGGCPSFSSVTFVPRRASSERVAGVDQARMLAENLAERLGVRFEALLQRQGGGADQKTLSSAERTANVIGLYSLRREAEPAGGNVLLVDDVYTTGSTLRECAKLLLGAGADAVFAAVFAKTPYSA